MIAVSLGTVLLALTLQLPEPDNRLFVPSLKIPHLESEGKSDPWPIEIDAGDTLIQAQRVIQTWSIAGAHGLRVHVAGMVVYESQSGRTWYTCLRSNHPIDRVAVDRDEFSFFRLVIDATALTGFLVRDHYLYVGRSEGRSSSLEAAANAAVESIEHELEAGWPATRDLIPPHFVGIDLYPTLGEWLRAGQPCCAGPAEPFLVTITKITVVDGNWQLDLRNGEGKTATLILTSDFKITDVSVEPRRKEK